MSLLELLSLTPSAFEHMVNALALKVLGAGASSFGPGSDGGRDGYFRGDAPYPSDTDRWRGTWYLQSKFHGLHLSKDPQKWLLQQISDELDLFASPESNRSWPDVWIVATNIDPSGVPQTGSFDAARALVAAKRPKLAEHFDIWGGSKILSYLDQHRSVAQRYGHFLTPGHVLTELLNELADQRASIDKIVRTLLVKGLDDHRYTKLEQAGSHDIRPEMQDLFVDLPVRARDFDIAGSASAWLASASSEIHTAPPDKPRDTDWTLWSQFPTRSRSFFLKAGPGRGKSTIGQYFAQLNRASLLLASPSIIAPDDIRSLAERIRSKAGAAWPTPPRLPLQIDLKEYAHFYSGQSNTQPRGILSFVATTLTRDIQEPVSVGLLRRALTRNRWLVVFDGLDEVPSAIKDTVAREVQAFLRDDATETDLLTICTSRPQGYSGQFDLLGCTTLEFEPLTPREALQCADRVIRIGQTHAEAEKKRGIINSALETSPAVRELMTTPLQAHIVAVIVRSGHRPPERKWELYRQFYEVIRLREIAKELPDSKIAQLLTREPRLLRTVHNRLGFLLHACSETVQGAQARISQADFRDLVASIVEEQKEGDHIDLVATLMESVTVRLVLISTPESSDFVSFDIRPLQEFFAAEHCYDGVTLDILRQNLALICGDAHWREVAHFLLSALIEQNRRNELTIALDILRSTDTSWHGTSCAALARAMANGGLAAAKLLSDGVLEQDKSVRSLFLERIEGLGTACAGDALELICSLQEPASRSWAIDVMLTAAERLVPSRSTGAVAVIWTLVKDSDPRLHRVVQLASMVRALCQRDFSRILRSTCDWHVLMIVKASESDSATAAEICSKLSRYRNPKGTIWPRLKAAFRARHGAVADDLLSLYDIELASTVDEDLGPITMLRYYADDTTQDKLSKLSAEEMPEGAPKVLSVLHDAVRWYVDNDRAALARAYLFLKETDDLDPEHLPNVVQRMLPAPDNGSRSDLADVIPSLSLDELKAGLGGRSFGSIRLDDMWRGVHFSDPLFPFGPGTPNSDAISVLFRHDPRIGLTILDVLRRDILVLFLPFVLECIEKTPSLAAFVSVIIWPFMLDAAGPRQQELRRILREHAPAEVTLQIYWEAEAERCSFRLVLPDDSSLLPGIASYVVIAFGIDVSEETADLSAPESRRSLKAKCAKMVSEFCPDHEPLLALAGDTNTDQEIRGAALVLLALHPSFSFSLVFSFKDLLTDLARHGSSVPLALAYAIDILQFEHVPDVVSLIDGVFETASLVAASGSIRTSDLERWADLLSRWRERSNSPVTNFGVGRLLPIAPPLLSRLVSSQPS